MSPTSYEALDLVSHESITVQRGIANFDSATRMLACKSLNADALSGLYRLRSYLEMLNSVTNDLCSLAMVRLFTTVEYVQFIVTILQKCMRHFITICKE